MSAGPSMSVSPDLRSLLRERLTVVMDLVLTQVLLELDRTFKDYEANRMDQEESPKSATSLDVYSAGVQFPERPIKQELQEESSSVSELQSPESPQVEVRRCFPSGADAEDLNTQTQTTNCSSELPAAENVEDCNEIQITSPTSLNSSLSACQDPNACKVLSSNLGIKQEKEEQSSDMLQPFSCVTSSDVPHVKQEPTDSTCALSEHVQVEEFQINSVTSLSTSMRTNPPLTSSSELNQNMDTEMEGKSPDQEHSDSEEHQGSECDKMESSSQEKIVNKPILPKALNLKLPVIKLHPLFPKTGAKNVKLVSKITPTKPKNKKRVNVARKGIKYMCYCGKLFTKEALEIHKMSQDGQDRPFGCPSSVKPSSQLTHSKRRRYEAFNVKGSKPTIEESECFETEWNKVSEYNQDGEMEDFPNLMGQREETQSCEDTNLRYLKENFLCKSNTTHSNEKNKVCEKDEAGPLKDQISAPLDLDTEVKPNDMSKPFSCDVCGHGFSWLPGLYKHRRNHFVTGPFWCSDCGRTFRFVEDLRSHVCVQTGNKPYSCSVCMEAFFLKIQLENHMKQHKSARKRGSGRTETGLN